MHVDLALSVTGSSMSFIGMITRHLHTTANEHLTLQTDSKKMSVKDQHILTCEERKLKYVNVNHFKVIMIGKCEYKTKVQEALSIKKQNPKLNC